MQDLLFTDIEGRKWEEQPWRMAQAMDGHGAPLRDLVQANRERIVKTTGDGIYAAFETPADGMASVLAIQLS